MKKINLVLSLGLAGALFLASCSKDDGGNTITPIPSNPNEVSISADITSDTEWTSDKIYKLTTRIAVKNGATLTIQPGTIIKGDAGSGANSSALIIARGSKIDAQGTATKPIIFTSVADNIGIDDITNGNFNSPNLSQNEKGFWGGLIVLGSAPISVANGTETNIDGIPPSDPNGLYGGSNPTDNSGILKYISIRHGGTNIGEGNEINGLSLGGVGSGTVIDNIEIVGNQDDGVEFFGGTVNVTNVVVWSNGDDAIDTDMAWSGTLDNFIVVNPSGFCFELDGPEGTATGRHTIKNGSVIVGGGAALINVDANSDVSLENIYFSELSSDGGQQIEGDKTTDFSSCTNVSLTNVVIDTTGSSLNASGVTDFIDDGSTQSGVSIGTTKYANKSVFSWTWTSQAGILNNL